MSCWLVNSSRPLTNTTALREVLQVVQGPRVDPPINLDGLTFDQVKGWNCALSNARLHADRPLGVFSTDQGLVTDPTELWACAPACAGPARAEC